MELRRLLPDPGVTTPEAAHGGLRLGDLAPAGRPYVVANMIASVDGRAAVDGHSGPLGGPADRELFHRLRTQVDAVLGGTGTLRAERYGPLAKNEELRAARAAEGLAPDPLALVLTRSGEVPLDIPLFADPRSRVVIATEAAGDFEAAAQVEVLRYGPGELTPSRVLARLRRDHGIRSVLCEGGPQLLGALLADGALDELFLCLAPRLVTGDEPALLEAVRLESPRELRLLHALEHDGHLFLRYRL